MASSNTPSKNKVDELSMFGKPLVVAVSSQNLLALHKEALPVLLSIKGAQVVSSVLLISTGMRCISQ